MLSSSPFGIENLLFLPAWKKCSKATLLPNKLRHFANGIAIDLE